MIDEIIIRCLYDLNNEHIKAIRRYVYHNTTEENLVGEVEFISKFLAMFIDQFIGKAAENDPTVDIRDINQYKQKYLALAVAVLPDIVTRYQQRLLDSYQDK